MLPLPVVSGQEPKIDLRLHLRSVLPPEKRCQGGQALRRAHHPRAERSATPSDPGSFTGLFFPTPWQFVQRHLSNRGLRFDANSRPPRETFLIRLTLSGGGAVLNVTSMARR